MRRAALMQCAGDPYVVSYWLRNFERVWAGEVDQLHVHVNGQEDAAVVEAIAAEIRAVADRTLTDTQILYQPGRMVHGVATRELVQSADVSPFGAPDLVLLIEDDAYVRELGAVSRHFDGIEAGEADVFATPRGGMDPEIFEYAVERWHDHDLTSPEGNMGPGLWPCFVFARLADLQATSQRFESLTWQPGETIHGLGYTVPPGKAMCTDSFTTTAFELRNAGLRIAPTWQYKELWDKTLPEDRWAPWFHAGGLSNGDFLSEHWDGGQARADIGGSNEGLDWAHRIWWWRRCLDTAGDAFLHHRQAEYRARLERLVDFTGVREQVEAWTPILEPWISWDDAA